ncbi:MAG: LOG family protein [Hyphomicrobiaceae bacterium]
MSDNGEQTRSRSYLLPVEDTEFLLRDELRSIRFALEYSKADLLLRDWGVRSTVVVFGSARVPSPEQAEAMLKSAVGPEALVQARKRAAQSIWYEQAQAFGKLVSQRGGALDASSGARDNVIATGGGPGIMEAANRGANDAGAPSIGFNITLPQEQQPNRYSTPDLTFRFHYFAMRKMHLAMRANALAVFPGGFGTLDELFELLTLQQTRKAPAMPVILFDRAYWRAIVNFEAMVEASMVAAADLALFDIVDTVEEAWSALLRRGLTAHAADPAP